MCTTIIYLFSCFFLVGFLKTLSPKRPFCVQQSFSARNKIKVAITKTIIVQPLLFSLLLLSFSPLFLFLISFSFVTVILEFLGLKKPAFWCLFTPEVTTNFVSLVFKNQLQCRFIVWGKFYMNTNVATRHNITDYWNFLTTNVLLQIE